MLNVLLTKGRSLQSIAPLLKDYRVDSILEGEDLSQKISKNSYDLILMQDGLEKLPMIKAMDPRAEVILFGGGDVDELEAIRQGAAAYFKEPVDLKGFQISIDNIREMTEMRFVTNLLKKQLDEKYKLAGVVGRNPQILDIFDLIRRIAPYYKTVTITGETGTGKEEMAKALHSISPVADKPFVVCNCGTLVEHLIESELFGHKKGAFTGAISDKIGIFEAAGEGTIFLDEIGELPLSFQTHLLRVLQNGEFRRLGSNEPLKARCRVIVATNRDLAEEVKAKRFREDLYFRITPFTINMPPLRERKDDIQLLCNSLLDRSCERTGKKICGFSRTAQAALMAYDWPGNIRELDNAIDQAVILTKEAFIRFEDLPPYIHKKRDRRAPSVPKPLDELIRAHIEEALKLFDGNRTNAAKTLGISRRALIRKIEKYSIEQPAGSHDSSI